MRLVQFGRDLVSIETKTGQIRWQKNVRKAFGGEPVCYAEDFGLVERDLRTLKRSVGRTSIINYA